MSLINVVPDGFELQAKAIRFGFWRAQLASRPRIDGGGGTWLK
jgi:hypothetical protein